MTLDANTAVGHLGNSHREADDSCGTVKQKKKKKERKKQQHTLVNIYEPFIKPLAGGRMLIAQWLLHFKSPTERHAGDLSIRGRWTTETDCEYEEVGGGTICCTSAPSQLPTLSDSVSHSLSSFIASSPPAHFYFFFFFTTTGHVLYFSAWSFTWHYRCDHSLNEFPSIWNIVRKCKDGFQTRSLGNSSAVTRAQENQNLSSDIKPDSPKSLDLDMLNICIS